MKNMRSRDKRPATYEPSKLEKGECANEDCAFHRRPNSAFCQSCSDKHKKA